jgi:hypothetical protein
MILLKEILTLSSRSTLDGLLYLDAIHAFNNARKGHLRSVYPPVKLEVLV